MGLSALPCIMADAEPELQKIAGPEMVGSLELWLLARRDLAQFPHVRTVMDFIIARVRSLRPSLSGNTGSNEKTWWQIKLLAILFFHV